MKKIFFVLLIFTVEICAQTTNKIIKDSKTEKPMLIGACDRTAFNDTNFSGWFSHQYEFYKIDKEKLNKIVDKIDDYNITIVMGTWCSDSRREVPRVYKILDYLNYPDDNITLINVNRKREASDTGVDILSVELVPTIIFYDHNKEVGRIVETPENTLEEDMIKIISESQSN